ncbi:hypothetical protein Dimus_038570 [Dionaea muscipula]
MVSPTAEKHKQIILNQNHQNQGIQNSNLYGTTRNLIESQLASQSSQPTKKAELSRVNQNTLVNVKIIHPRRSSNGTTLHIRINHQPKSNLKSRHIVSIMEGETPTLKSTRSRTSRIIVPPQVQGQTRQQNQRLTSNTPKSSINSDQRKFLNQTLSNPIRKENNHENLLYKTTPTGVRPSNVVILKRQIRKSHKTTIMNKHPKDPINSEPTILNADHRPCPH